MNKNVCSLAIALIASACASSAPRKAEHAPSSPRCPLVGIEQVTSESDAPSDSVALVVSYRPPGRPEASAEGPVSMRVRVQRNRVDDLQAQLATQPDLLCEPEPGAPGGYRAFLP